MGYLRHQAIVVSGYHEDVKLQHADLVAVVSSRWPDFERLISPVVAGVANGHASFLIGVDGSKEGWEDSKTADDVRAAAKALFLQHGNTVDWVEIAIGGDDGSAAIDDTNLTIDDEADDDI